MMKRVLLSLVVATITVGCGEGTYESHESDTCCQSYTGTLRVMTLNVAHGRGTAWHQAAVLPSAIERNLDRIADVTVREEADVLGLQEADGAAAWSGGFDHVEYLGKAADFFWWVRGGHSQNPHLDYGTGILGRPEVSSTEAIDFTTFGPGFHKGYTVSTLTLDGVEIDVVSLHLDPILGVRRKKQVRQIVEHLSERDRPRIVMGDFNVVWKEGNPLHIMTEELDLQAHRPESDEFATYDAKRLDWVLISEDSLEFEDYWTVPDTLSDHKAVRADVVLR